VFGTPEVPLGADVYSPDEIADAAGVAVEQVRQAIAAGQVVAFRGFLPESEAVRLVRWLTGAAPAPSSRDRTPVLATIAPSRRSRAGLAASGVMHAAAVVLLLLLSSWGWLAANDTEARIDDPKPARLVFMMMPGPGGGGGGGGLKMPAPPPPAERKAPVKLIKRTSSPVPPVRRTPPPPPPRPQPIERRIPPPPLPPLRVEPVVVEPPKPAPAVQAPVVPVPADPVDTAGVPVQAAPAPPSNGPGTGGGIGSGRGTGLGEGQGGGIGPGSGGGTGGGPFQPGNGIDPPQLLREVRPSYTDEARRRMLEGDVVLEIIVRRDGTVGNMRVLRSLGAGLDQKALDAVRQWRFGPAKRQGAPVDVVVEVSVEFKLR
jgi:periplasmic protein TonB